MEGLTLDTGALIALERREARAIRVIYRAQQRGLPITVPSVVVVEWWRGQRGPVARLLDAFTVEPLRVDVALTAGRALAMVEPGPSVVDACVMASAARRGDLVYTSDVSDLERLRTAFPSVRVLGV